MRHLLVAFLAFLLVLPLAASAQTADDHLTEGILAFRDEQYSSAVASFEKAIELDEENAEAYFLLARLYFESPLDDRKRARKYLEQAIDLEPDNVEYLVAHLLHLRVDSWSFLTDRIRESKRRGYAKRILELDSTNAYANEEMGVGYIRDFWRYRNAIMVPGLDLGRSYEPREFDIEDPSNLPENALDFQGEDPNALGSDFIDDVLRTTNEDFIESLDPQDVFFADEFDIEKLEESGVPIQDLSARAQRVYDRAVGHLNLALENNPRQRNIYDHLMKIFALKGEYSDALKMLEQMYVYFPEDPGLWTYLGLSHYYAGNHDAAAKSFEQSLKLMPEEESQAFADLTLILPDDQKDLFREDPVVYSSRYWTSQDPRFLTTYNERKVEHFARLVYSDLLYSAPQLNLRGWDTIRGQILVRYGKPPVDVTIVPRNNFRSLTDGSTELETADNMFNSLNTFNIWDYGEFKFVFEDPFRNGEFRLYSPPADQIAAGALPWTNDYAIKAKETFKETPERFEYEAPGRQIELPYLVNAFKSSVDGQTDVYIHYGVPIVQYDPTASAIEVTGKEGTFLVNDDYEIVVEKRRTIYGLKTTQIVEFEESNLWINTQTMSAPPGNHDLSVEFEIGDGSTIALQRRTVTLPDFSNNELSMSDVMLAYRIEETDNGAPLSTGDIVRSDLSISPAPWSVFSSSQPLYLYFEVYDLGIDNGTSDFTVEAILTKKDTKRGVAKLFSDVFGGRKKGVSVSLPLQGSSSSDGRYLIMDVSNQEPGLFTLIVRVKDNNSGREVDSQQDLFIE